MITKRELFKRPVKIPPQHEVNIDKLLIAINKLRLAYGKPLQVTSGYRSLDEHLAIYAAKGITDQKKIPMKSKHLEGLAVDLVPVDESIEEFHKWIKDNVELLEQIGLWLEDFKYSKTWAHFQIVAPRSGNRFFIP
jgi:hypothetical protein